MGKIANFIRTLENRGQSTAGAVKSAVVTNTPRVFHTALGVGAVVVGEPVKAVAVKAYSVGAPVVRAGVAKVAVKVAAANDAKLTKAALYELAKEARKDELR